MIRHMLTALLLLTVTTARTGAQATPDSVAIWTARLGQGKDGMRALALGQLAELPRAALPAATQQAMISELRRLNAQLLGPATTWSGEASSEYYMSLVGAVAALETTDAYRALIPSIGVSRGVGMRVAQLGDEAVPALRALIDRGYEKDVALGTLGFVSFWADSTGAPLSATSRAEILQAFLRASADPSFDSRLGLLMGIESAADPALLPLARALQAKAQENGDRFITYSLKSVIATLETRNRQLSLADLMRIVQRNVQSICERAVPSNRQAVCRAVQNEMQENVRHIERGETAAARSGLTSALGAADRARAGGYITLAEHTLIVGSIKEILTRL